MKQRLSPSMLRIARWCLRRLGYEYVKFPGHRWRPNAAMASGRAVHSSVEQNLQRRIDGGEYMPIAEVRDLAADAFSAEAFDVEWSHEEVAADNVKDEVVKMAVAHRTSVAPRILPMAVEQKMEAQLKGTGWVLVGKADVISMSGSVGVVRNGEATPPVSLQREIRDTKTKRGAPKRLCGQAQVLGADRVQAVTYRLIWAAQNTPAHRSWVDYLWTAEASGRCDSGVVNITDQECRNVLEDYLELIAVLEKGIFPRTGYGTWMCVAGQCAHYEMCILGKDRALDV